MKGVILAGGKGTRLSPLTKVTNKHLLPVYNKPMIEYPINTLKSFRIDEILIVTGGEYIGRFAELLGDGHKYGVELTYRVQEEADGIAGALLLAKDFVGDDDVAVILGDNIFEEQTEIAGHLFAQNLMGRAKIFTKEIINPERFGVVKYEQGRAVSIIEKPKEFVSHDAVVGLYVYPSEVFNVISNIEKSDRGEFEITDVNNYFLSRGECDVIGLDGFWSDAGTFESLLESSNWVAEHDKS